MILAVTDTETTGLGDSDQVCELAVATVGDRKLSGTWSTLIKPTCSMSIGARATHHITDEELSEAPTMVELLLRRGLPEYGCPPLNTASEDVIFVAHNAGYDRRMLVQSGVHQYLLPRKTICTWRCALHLYPDSERHSNQHLRYALDLKPAFACSDPPHRALPDVAVTTAILLRMLETHAPEELVRLTETPVLLTTVNFGKYRGTLWRDLDVGMLRWILSRDFGEDEKYTAKHWLDQKSRPRLVPSPAQLATADRADRGRSLSEAPLTGSSKTHP